ncbi:MAG: hypothetical protein ACLFQX_06440 [Candidatus Kapaibacterium sp.]
MSITKIKIVILGNLRHELDLKKLKKFKSKLFIIDQIETLDNLPRPTNDYGTYDIVYSRDETEDIMKNIKYSDIVLGIMNYRFDDNFYLHRTGQNCACLSIADIDHLLFINNISIENFILKNIYEIILIKMALKDISNDDVYSIVHRDTRGCLFDMNGYKYDVIYNTENPVICDSCKAFFGMKALPEKYIHKLERELKKIRKPRLLKFELFIKKYPLASILFTILISILINIISNIFWVLLI